jgi:hypothetical protein
VNPNAKWEKENKQDSTSIWIALTCQQIFDATTDPGLFPG